MDHFFIIFVNFPISSSLWTSYFLLFACIVLGSFTFQFDHIALFILLVVVCVTNKPFGRCCRYLIWKLANLCLQFFYRGLANFFWAKFWTNLSFWELFCVHFINSPNISLSWDNFYCGGPYVGLRANLLLHFILGWSFHALLQMFENGFPLWWFSM